jgi:plastocyanin
MASIRAFDFGWEDPVTGDSSTTVAAGGTVTFSYPSGFSSHNVSFETLQPTTCTQTAGTNVGSVPPLPASPQSAGWSGTCRFDTPGAYAFVCDLHGGMRGTVDVVDPTGTTTTPSTGTTTTLPGGTGPADTTPTDPAPGGSPPALPSFGVARRQRGAVVRGSVTTPAGPSRIVVTAFASRRSLAGGAASRVRIGSLSKRSTGTGRTAFAVKLRAAARRALRQRGRLAVSLRIVVTPPSGPAAVKNARVALRSG